MSAYDQNIYPFHEWDEHCPPTDHALLHIAYHAESCFQLVALVDELITSNCLHYGSCLAHLLQCCDTEPAILLYMWLSMRVLQMKLLDLQFHIRCFQLQALFRRVGRCHRIWFVLLLCFLSDAC